MNRNENIIERKIIKELITISKQFPIVSVTGPRQSGKTTLIKYAFSDYDYINLENPNTRKLAQSDPISFIGSFKNKLIIDEAQYVPDVFSAVQVLSDENEIAGRFVLSGSQNFLLLKNITQSLAGRVAIVKLMPLSYWEINKYDKNLSYSEIMINGGYPRLYSSDIKKTQFFDSYIQTYVQRDVSNYLDVRNTVDFTRFTKLIASRCGQLLNYADIAKKLSINVATVKSWMSILVSSYICFLLPPYYKNVGKRLIKTPKVYFYDTGLLCHLLDIKDISVYHQSEDKGKIFENFVISETFKTYLNKIKDPNLMFYRDVNKNEVDLLEQQSLNTAILCEIKASSLYQEKYSRGVKKVGKMLNIDTSHQFVVYGGDITVNAKGVNVSSFPKWISLHDEFNE